MPKPQSTHNADDHRRHQRYAHRVWLEFVQFDEADRPIAHHAANAVDVSMGGMCMLTAQPLPNGTRLLILLRPSGPSADASVHWGVVKWSRRQANGWMGSGVQFEPLPPAITAHSFASWAARVDCRAGRDDTASGSADAQAA